MNPPWYSAGGHMGCFDDNDIALLTSGAPSPAERSQLTHHLDTCVDCRELVAQALRIEGHGAIEPVQPGDKVGRYLVLETVGAGAMGAVYAAYDPELGRKIALKLLHPDPVRDLRNPEGRARLLAEAQSLARLSHPHVTTIHDVGTVGDQVFLAMEFAEGGNLNDWLRAEPRSWRQTATMMAQVGEGLAAAHEAQLIHRDLKPQNVVIDGQARPRLTDFGLAQGTPGADAVSPADSFERLSMPVGSLTATGALVGTPAYMAPEQLRGESATELSDQFSFCVTLYEALFGIRPYAGKTVAELLSASQQPAVLPRKPRVPPWLERLLARGLSADPAARFPSMQALLAQLRRGLDARPWRRGSGLAATVVALVAAAGWFTRPATSLCSGGPAAWGSAWDDATAQQLHAAVAASQRPGIEATERELNRLLIELRTRWQATYGQICEATRSRGEQSEALLDVRLACLADRRNEVAALSGVLAQGEAKVLERAVSAVLSLPRLEACATARSSGAPQAAQVAPAALAQLSADLAKISVLQYVSKLDEAQQLAAATLDRASAPGFLPQLSRLQFLQGKVASSKADHASAERLLHQAAATAEEARDDLAAADAWTALISVVGMNLSRPEEGRRWARYGEAALRRAGGDDEREALRLRQLGMIAWRLEGRLDEALELSQRARRLTEQAHGERVEFQRALCDENLAGIFFDMGRVDEALALHRQVAATTERLFGAEHPRLATAEVNIGEDLVMLDKPDEGIPWLRRGMALAVSANAAPGIDGYYRHRLGAAFRHKGDFARALEEDTRAVAASALAGERGNYWESWSLTGLGLDLLGLNRAPEAVAPLTEAVRERMTGAPAADLAESRQALGEATWEAGDHAGGRVLMLQALEGVRPQAARYGRLFARRQQAIEAWLKQH